MVVGVARRDVDGGWAWVVLVAAFVSSAIIYGFHCNGGIYFVTFLDAFGQSRSYTSMVYTVQVVALHGGGPVSSMVLGRFGARTTMISGSLLATFCLIASFFAMSIPILTVLFGLAGLASILVMTGSLAAVSIYFVQHFYTATGLTNSGAGVGISAIGAFIEWTTQTVGWRGSMLLLAGVLLQMTLCGALIFHVPQKILGRPEKETCRDDAVSLRSLCKDLRWYSLFLNMLLFFFSWNMVIVIIKDSFLAMGFRGISYQSAVISFGIANTVGRLSSGFFSKFLLNPPLQAFVTSVVGGGAVLGVMVAADQWLYIACVIVYYFCMGQMAVLPALSIAYIYGNKAMPTLWGYGILSGIVSIGGIPMSGYLVDVSGSYNSTFVLVALCNMASGLFSLICYVIHQRKLESRANLAIKNDKIGEKDELEEEEEESFPLSKLEISETKALNNLS